MKRLFVLSVIITCSLIVGCAIGQKVTSLEGMPADAPVQQVQLKGEDCSWVPDRIRVEKGAHVILEVTSVDRDYNFYLKGYDLKFAVPEGKTVTAEFYASKPGEYGFGCYLAPIKEGDTGAMAGTLIVE